MMKKIKGFTLLEILIVVIIVGILAALAIPYYVKTAESSKAAEAYANLNALRQAEWVYYGKSGNFADDGEWTWLNIENPNDIPSPSRLFFYWITVDATNPATPFNLGATRVEGPYFDDYIVMHANGMLDESNWLTGTGGGGGGAQSPEISWGGS